MSFGGGDKRGREKLPKTPRIARHGEKTHYITSARLLEARRLQPVKLNAH